MARARAQAERQVILVDAGRRLTRRQWRRFEQVGFRAVQDLDELVLNWSDRKVKDLEARGMITSVQVEATLEGAPNVTVTLRDPERVLFRRRPGRVKERRRSRRSVPVQVDEGWDPVLPPDVLGRPMQISLDGVTYQLVKVAYSETSGEAQLTFEHELVYLLKRHKGTKRAPRSKVTRAQFILSLVRELEPEVRRRRYRFVCPELNVRQPIDKAQRQRTPATTRPTATSSGGQGGRNLDRVFPAHGLGEPGVKLTEQEIKACAAAGGFWGQELQAAYEVALGESAGGCPGIIASDGGIGLWQMTPWAWGAEGKAEMARLGGPTAMRNPVQNAKMARVLYTGAGKRWRTQWYGVGHLKTGDGPGNGQPTRAECRELAETVTGGGQAEGAASSKTVTDTKSYQFRRGAKESSWAAIVRLGQEVKWRPYMVGNSLYYMSEEALYTRRPRYEVTPDHDAVVDLGYDVDWGKAASEATLTVTLAKWGAPPGSVILLEGFGPLDGRWLVAGTSRDYFSPLAEVKLVQPARALLEPAAEQKTRTVRVAGQSNRGGSDAASGPAEAQRFYERAKEIHEKNYPYVWGGGHGTGGKPSGGTGRDPGIGYDCSGYIGACCLAAGWGDAAHSSQFGSFPKAKPGRGRYISVYYNNGHVYAVFEKALGVPWGSADTNTINGGPRGPHLRHGGAYAGYSVCHYGS
jgi:hypothetical protein